MTDKNINLSSMTTPSAIISQLATQVDVPTTIMSISDEYVTNTDMLPIQEKFSIQNNELNKVLKEKHTYGNILKDQHQVRKEVASMNCRETFLVLVKKELSKINSVVTMLEKYEDNYNKMKVNMELSYRVNKLHNLDDTKSKKIELKNVVPYNKVHHKLTTLQLIVDQFLDIKSVIYSPAGKKDTALYGLDSYVDMFSSDKVFQQHLKNFLLTDTDLDKYTRLEYYQDIHCSMTAHDAGYNNITCMTTINTLNKLARSIVAIKDSWYVNTPKYTPASKTQNRATSVLKSLTSQEYTGDNGTPYDTLCERINRYHFATKFITMVISPIILKEMENITSVMNDLRYHLVVDNDSKDIISTEVHSLVSKYKDDVTFFKFIDNKKPSDLILKGLEYSLNKSNKVYQNCNLLNSGFNRTNVKSITTVEDVPNITLTDMTKKMSAWSKVLNKFTEYMDSTINTEHPVANWATYQPDASVYRNMLQELKDDFTNTLDITVKSSTDKYHSHNLTSQYRNNLDLQLKVSSEVLGYNEQSNQWQFKLVLDTLQKELINCSQMQHDLRKKLQFVGVKLEDIKDQQVQAMIYCIGDLCQMCNFISHDLELMKKIFITE